MTRPVCDRILAGGTRSVIRRAGEAIGRVACAGDSIALVGPLGAGKTYFVQAIARGLGIPRAVRITSPTFTLVQTHDEGRVPLVHADWYRLERAVDVRDLALFELSDALLTVVEWADRCESEFPCDALWIEFDRVSSRSRRLRAGGSGERVQRLVSAAQRAS